LPATKADPRSIEAKSRNGWQRSLRDARIPAMATTFADALKECLSALGGVRTKAEIAAIPPMTARGWCIRISRIYFAYFRPIFSQNCQ
jgi:hypothetical protein